MKPTIYSIFLTFAATLPAFAAETKEISNIADCNPKAGSIENLASEFTNHNRVLRNQWNLSGQNGIVEDPCSEPFTNQAEKLTRDFGELCHYEKENRELPPATGKRVVFFGDSITQSWKTGDSKLFTDDIRCRGIAGQTSSQMLVRFKADVLDLKPRVVHILAGTNDIAGNTGPTTMARIQSNIAAMVLLAKAQGIKVILGSILPTKNYSWAPEIDPRGFVQKINAWLENFSKKEKVTYADYYSVMVDQDGGMKKELSDDGVHPNAKGYQTMGTLVKTPLEKAGIIGSNRRGSSVAASQ